MAGWRAFVREEDIPMPEPAGLAEDRRLQRPPEVWDFEGHRAHPKTRGPAHGAGGIEAHFFHSREIRGLGHDSDIDTAHVNPRLSESDERRLKYRIVSTTIQQRVT